MSILDKGVDKTFEIFSSKDKTKLYLLGFLILGFILRLISAINTWVAADDVGHAIYAINFLKSGQLEVYHQSAGLWYALTDLFYNIFGLTQFASRFASILFGTASILLIFLVVKEFGSKKAGLIAAFLLAVSPWHIKNTLAEMDVTVMFFIMVASLFFLYGLKDKKISKFAISGLFFGLAIYTKVYSLLFIPSFIIYAYYTNKSGDKIKDLYKPLLVFLLIAFIFAIPTLTYNYLLYKEKGYVDLLFTRTLGIAKEKAAQFYSWDASWGSKSDWAGLFFGNSANLPWSKMPSGLYAILFFLKGDPIVFILGVLGLIFAFRKNKRVFFFSVIFMLFCFLYLASIVLLCKHYIFLLMFSLIPASLFLEKIKIRLRYVFLAILVFNLVWLGFNNVALIGNFYSTSAMQQMISYKSNIPDNGFIIADSRIYRGQIHWMFEGKNYVEASYFEELFKISEQGVNKISIPVYFVECDLDDCGWGTIAGQQEFNQSMEDMASFFEKNGNLEKKIYSTSDTSSYFPWQTYKEKPHFSIYKMNIELDPSIMQLAKKTHIWWLHPIGYDVSINLYFDMYSTNGFFDVLLNSLAHLIRYVSLVLALGSIILVFYLFLR
ncbi:MAG: glycosyltransferase family 39 protein [Candidatus Pacearchaeota archaeon]|nr:glycosyltransferase family 39 protein [Candidatus Pacearchaeota archaeon]